MAGKKRDDDCGGNMDGDFALRLLHALNHETRRKALRLLADTNEAMSPAAMSRKLDLPVSIVSYHVKILRACHAVEEARMQHVHGAIEHFYETLLRENQIANVLLESTREVDGDDAE